MEKDFILFEINRERLKKLFLKLSSTDKKMNFINFQKFCLISKIIPVINNQNFVNQIQINALAKKLGNSAPLNKILLSYEQFENQLKLISVSKSQPASKLDKTKVFFNLLSQALKVGFQVHTDNKSIVNRSSSVFTLHSVSDLNETNNSLDLSIKEALNKVKSNTKRTAQAKLSPRLGRAYSNSSRSSKTLEPYNKVKVSLVPSSSLSNLKIKRKANGELDEFLETERLVEKDVVAGKASLKPKENALVKNIKHSYQKSDLDSFNHVFKVTEKINNLVLEPKFSKEKVLADSCKAKSITKHRDFIVNLKKSKFSTVFVVGIIFRAWKMQTKKNKRV
jgi:hypothetical protein